MSANQTTPVPNSAWEFPPDVSRETVFDLWKHYATTGGADKNIAVTIGTWLLGFSTVLIGLAIKGELNETWKSILVLVIGIGVDLITVFIVIQYASYAHWHWEQAWNLERTSHLKEFFPRPLSERNTKRRTLMTMFIDALGQPCDPTRRLAFVFLVFVGIAVVSAAVHIYVFWMSQSSQFGMWLPYRS